MKPLLNTSNWIITDLKSQIIIYSRDGPKRKKQGFAKVMLCPRIHKFAAFQSSNSQYSWLISNTPSSFHKLKTHFMNFNLSNSLSELSPACRCPYKTPKDNSACQLHVYSNQWTSNLESSMRVQLIRNILALNSSRAAWQSGEKGSQKVQKAHWLMRGVSIPANIMLGLFCILCWERRDVICEASLHSWINATLWLLTLLMKLQGKPEGH